MSESSRKTDTGFCDETPAHSQIGDANQGRRRGVPNGANGLRIQPVDSNINNYDRVDFQPRLTCATSPPFPKGTLRIVSSPSPTKKAKLSPSPKQR
ncbi:hypothetical protein CBM2585_B140022 [Cupriavidus taiwanensis]|nr:hypothetical protein CBM2585_B140022 [Cupriavidus taiwanensis]SPC23881.1 hypothetical protein CT19431_MP90023 [Cupriavidus taiwanensis]